MSKYIFYGRAVMLFLWILPLTGCGNSAPSQNAKIIEVPGKCVLFDFEDNLSGWEIAEGNWASVEADHNGVLKQSATDKTYPLALWTEKRFSDVDISVRFRPISGNEDASGGVVFRAKDGKNYYLARANALEDNFRLYTVKDGSRRQLCGTTVEPPKLGEWHTLRVVAAQDHIQAFLDNRLLIDFHDSTYNAGVVGLWTKADSVTMFDDLKITGDPIQGK